MRKSHISILAIITIVASSLAAYEVLLREWGPAIGFGSSWIILMIIKMSLRNEVRL